MATRYAISNRNETHKLRKNLVQVITFRCRPIGHPDDPVEEGTIEGFWTGAIDTWGKYTIRLTSVIGDDTLEYYLFPERNRHRR